MTGSEVPRPRRQTRRAARERSGPPARPLAPGGSHTICLISEPVELLHWYLLQRTEEPSVIVIVVDDSDDDELTSAIAAEDQVPSPSFRGLWGSGQSDGSWLVAFQLIQLGGALEREWYTTNIHRALVETILDVPHYVSIMPAEIAGAAMTLEAVIPRLGGSLMVEVDHRSPQVAAILA